MTCRFASRTKPRSLTQPVTQSDDSVNHLVFPDRVTLNVQLWSPSETKPYGGLPLAFRVRTFARAKNDYDLGPFFCGHDGVLAITRRQLELAAAAVLSTGLMDFDAIDNAFPFIEIVHWSGLELERAIDARSKTWTMLLEGEAELYGSVSELLSRLRSSGNASLRPADERYGRLRDEWDGTRPERTYTYTVSLVRSA